MRRIIKKVYCVACGLEIYPDDPLRVHPTRKTDAYHDVPYPCWPFERTDI